MIQITSINTRFRDGEITSVDVRFNFKGLEGRVDSNTRIEMTPEEYAGNEPIDKLVVKVKEMLIESLQEDDAAE
ncbi:hypothetical protein HXA31_20060 [Salipaludibacillus agaradhaerens]|jgi:hypothetical protein|uniref:hypothetical protein n=1 Tax=Salipaludibacillus TaxID=1884449 RepID=UPI0020D05B21|nr:MULTISPECIES: hypothetical protein [Salipaludibacillus]MCR6116625.1 hypothetical protein [Salipaludibacillus agaradhaerens]UTR13497.1 hypothetical protein MM221_12755 [Salipaludibacillus sp. LMS25]